MALGYKGSILYKVTKEIEEKGGKKLETKAWTKAQTAQIEKQSKKIKQKTGITPKQTTGTFQGALNKFFIDKIIEYTPYVAGGAGSLAAKGVSDVVGDMFEGKQPIVSDLPLPVQSETGELLTYDTGTPALPVLIKEAGSPIADTAGSILGITGSKGGFNLGTLDKILLAAGIFGGLWFASKFIK